MVTKLLILWPYRWKCGKLSFSKDSEFDFRPLTETCNIHTIHVSWVGCIVALELHYELLETIRGQSRKKHSRTLPHNFYPRLSWNPSHLYLWSYGVYTTTDLTITSLLCTANLFSESIIDIFFGTLQWDLKPVTLSEDRTHDPLIMRAMSHRQ